MKLKPFRKVERNLLMSLIKKLINLQEINWYRFLADIITDNFWCQKLNYLFLDDVKLMFIHLNSQSSSKSTLSIIFYNWVLFEGFKCLLVIKYPACRFKVSSHHVKNGCWKRQQQKFILFTDINAIAMHYVLTNYTMSIE